MQWMLLDGYSYLGVLTCYNVYTLIKVFFSPELLYTSAEHLLAAAKVYKVLLNLIHLPCN